MTRDAPAFPPLTAAEGDDAATFQLSFIRRVIDETGPRLPGSAAERRGAALVAELIEEHLGQPAVQEPFRFAPHAAIGAIPLLGLTMALVATPLYYLYPPAALAVMVAVLVFAVAQVFRYKGWFDPLFPQATSHNVYTVLEPPGGEPADRTVVMMGHVDSSWYSPHIHRGRPFLKIGYGLASAGLFLLLGIAASLDTLGVLRLGGPWLQLAPLPLIPGFAFIATYLLYDRRLASPGAMDNLSGIALSVWVARHLQRHPERWPAGCRLVVGGFGAEEAALKGSFAFVRAHRDDLLAGDVWAVITDGVSDADHCHVIDGDAWLGSRYDETLCGFAEAAYRDIDAPYTRMKNPVGGDDAHPLCMAGHRAVLLNAQDPGPSNRYHTFLDTADALEPRAMAILSQVALGVLDRIGEHPKKGKGKGDVFD